MYGWVTLEMGSSTPSWQKAYTNLSIQATIVQVSKTCKIYFVKNIKWAQITVKHFSRNLHVLRNTKVCNYTILVKLLNFLPCARHM